MSEKRMRKLVSQLEAGGRVRFTFGELSSAVGEDATTPFGRANIARRLREAGIVATPRISNIPPTTDTVELSLARGMSAAPDAGQASPPAISRKDRRQELRSEKERKKAAEENDVRGEIQADLDRAVEATDIVAQERALAQAIAAAQRNQGFFGGLTQKWVSWANSQIQAMTQTGKLKRGEYLGFTGHLQLFSDRIVWEEEGQLHVKPVDEHLRASIQTAGQLSSRPTLTRMAIGSVLPGTALIPGLAFKKTQDNRELYFVLEHPQWAKIVQLDPNAQAVAQQLTVAVNQAAAKAGYGRQQAEGTARAEAEERAREAERRAARASIGQRVDQQGYVEELRKLGELRDAGILTDEEFATQKAHILSRAQKS